jgi:hypothetical protein
VSRSSACWPTTVRHFGIDEVTFHKRTPLLTERSQGERPGAKRGGRWPVDEDRAGHVRRARATAPSTRPDGGDRAGHGGDRLHPGRQREQDEFYDQPAARSASWRRARSSGSERCTPGASTTRLCTRERPLPPHRVVQHPQHLGPDQDPGDGPGRHQPPRRRSLPVHPPCQRHQPGHRGSSLSPTVEKHNDERFGTHHARDAHGLFATLGYDLNLFSSAHEAQHPVHALHPLLAHLDEEMTLDEARRGC